MPEKNNLKIKVYIFAVSIGSCLGLISFFSFGSLLLLSIIILSGILMYYWLPQEDRVFLLRLYSAAVIFRIILLVVTYCISLNIGLRGEISPDSRYYTISALELSKGWREGIFAYTGDPHGIGIHTYMLAWFYTLVDFGRNSFSPSAMIADKLINVYIACISLLPMFFIAKEVFGKKIATFSTAIIAFWPTLVIWSITNLREPLNILVDALIIWSILAFYRKNRFRYFLVALFALILLSGIRPYLYPPLLLLTLTYFLIFLKIKLMKKMVLIILFVLIFFSGQKLIGIERIKQEYIDRAAGANSIESILRVNSNMIEQGGSSYRIYDPDVLIKDKINIPKFMLGFLKGVSYFIFLPFPWMMSSFVFLLYLPITLIWYTVLFFAVKGIIWSLKNRLFFSSLLLWVVGLITASFALVEGNVGSAIRHRDIISVFCIIFACVGAACMFKPELLAMDRQR